MIEVRCVARRPAVVLAAIRYVLRLKGNGQSSYDDQSKRGQGYIG